MGHGDGRAYVWPRSISSDRQSRQRVLPDSFSGGVFGLTSEWVSIHIEEPHKRILGVPDLLKLYLIIPIGHPDVPAREGVRRPIADIVHREALRHG